MFCGFSVKQFVWHRHWQLQSLAKPKQTHLHVKSFGRQSKTSFIGLQYRAVCVPRCHLTKLLIGLWQLCDGFCFKWPIELQEVREADQSGAKTKTTCDSRSVRFPRLPYLLLLEFWLAALVCCNWAKSWLLWLLLGHKNPRREGREVKLVNNSILLLIARVANTQKKRLFWYTIYVNIFGYFSAYEITLIPNEVIIKRK